MHAAGDKPLTVRLERDPNIPDALAGDAQRLGQVLTTLADTIVKTADAARSSSAHACSASTPGARRSRSRSAAPGMKSRAMASTAPRQSPQCHRRRLDGTHGCDRQPRRQADLGIGVSHRLVAALGGRLEVERKSALRQHRLRLHAPARAVRRRAVLRRIEHDPRAARGRRAKARRQSSEPTDRAPQRPQMNLDGIRERLHRNSHLLHRILLRFRADHAHFVDDYATLFRTNDRFGASQLARALESAAASLGAVELKQSCRATGDQAPQRR